MPRPDRSLSGAHEALRSTPRRRKYSPPAPARWSLPVTTALRWMLAAVLAVVALSLFGDVALQAVRGWLA